MSEPMPNDNARVNVSLSQLRAELTSLELRLVDRLNGALQNKADRAIQDQLAARVSDMSSRLTLVEQNMVVKDGPRMQKLDDIDQDITALKTVAGYKKWLWAQTVALAAIAIPVIFYALEHVTSKG